LHYAIDSLHMLPHTCHYYYWYFFSLAITLRRWLLKIAMILSYSCHYYMSYTYTCCRQLMPLILPLRFHFHAAIDFRFRHWYTPFQPRLLIRYAAFLHIQLGFSWRHWCWCRQDDLFSIFSAADGHSWCRWLAADYCIDTMIDIFAIDISRCHYYWLPLPLYCHYWAITIDADGYYIVYVFTAGLLRHCHAFTTLATTPLIDCTIRCHCHVIATLMDSRCRQIIFAITGHIGHALLPPCH